MGQEAGFSKMLTIAINIEPAVFMKRNIPGSGLAVFPQSGHAINLEEPDLFNRTVSDFLTAVEAGRWAELGL